MKKKLIRKTDSSLGHAYLKSALLTPKTEHNGQTSTQQIPYVQIP